MTIKNPTIIVCGANICSDSTLEQELKRTFLVIRCDHPSELNQILKGKQPDAILLGIDSQKEESALLLQLKKQYSAIPVIALGRDEPTEIAAQAFQNGVSDFFRIPYNEKLIVERTQAIIMHERVRNSSNGSLHHF